MSLHESPPINLSPKARLYRVGTVGIGVSRILHKRMSMGRHV